MFSFFCWEGSLGIIILDYRWWQLKHLFIFTPKIGGKDEPNLTFSYFSDALVKNHQNQMTGDVVLCLMKRGASFFKLPLNGFSEPQKVVTNLLNHLSRGAKTFGKSF